MYTQFFIKMPSKGNKTIVSRTIKDVQPNYTIKDFFKTVLLPHAKEEVGELVKVSIVLGDQSELMDIDDVNDLVENIVGFLWLLFSNLCDLTRLQTVTVGAA